MSERRSQRGRWREVAKSGQVSIALGIALPLLLSLTALSIVLLLVTRHHTHCDYNQTQPPRTPNGRSTHPSLRVRLHRLIGTFGWPSLVSHPGPRSSHTASSTHTPPNNTATHSRSSRPSPVSPTHPPTCESTSPLPPSTPFPSTPHTRADLSRPGHPPRPRHHPRHHARIPSVVARLVQRVSVGLGIDPQDSCRDPVVCTPSRVSRVHVLVRQLDRVRGGGERGRRVRLLVRGRRRVPRYPTLPRRRRRRLVSQHRSRSSIQGQRQGQSHRRLDRSVRFDLARRSRRRRRRQLPLAPTLLTPGHPFARSPPSSSSPSRLRTRAQTCARSAPSNASTSPTLPSNSSSSRRLLPRPLPLAASSLALRYRRRLVARVEELP
ncbi:hypothetical protein AAT19DRAFT_14192 [Rhodotorula toruloides]|uniref:Uncharacterized protein n=1 Tax=Rhodotorula toruloides TaxID=5286 RepID=A0A2T0AAY6_RHOTO|nr:hypothetical protein AAT19DRAFT_14192 [Rhodotorula toruloides]